MARVGWETHIGDANGKIALWLDEQGARDLRDLLSPEDRLREEIDAALTKAYPE